MKWVKGQTGNPNGRPRVPEIQELRDAIKTVESKKRKKLLEHFVSRGFVSDSVLVALAKKIVPDLSAVEMSGANGGAIEITDKTKRLALEEIDKRIKLLLGK